MKFTAAIVAVTVASASAFSVTMSSIGYLSNLGSTGGLTSFAPPAGSAPAAPAPASYQAPAPAPAPAASAPAPASAPYVSGFANVAPSNGLNYLGGLGGGGSMKSGRNFSGVSSSFKPTNTGPSYLANLPGQVMQSTYGSAAAPAQPSYSQPAAPAPQPAAPAPAPYTSSFAQPASSPAPASSGNYLDNLGGGGGGGAVSNSYSGMANSFAQATGKAAVPAGSSSGYLSSL